MAGRIHYKRRIYPGNIRRRAWEVACYYQKGIPRKQVAAIMGISLSTLDGYANVIREAFAIPSFLKIHEGLQDVDLQVDRDSRVRDISNGYAS